MFDWLRKATQSAEISRQERVLDYVDETLSAEARKRFEAELSADADLQREVAELRTVKAALNALPRQPVPRNFTLDPATYSKPARAWDVQLYPAMRMVTALSAIMFMIVATLTFLPFGAGDEFASAPSAMQSADFAEESAAEIAMVEDASPEMIEAVVEQGEADSAEFESAANSARVADETMADSAADSAEMIEMVEEESADAMSDDDASSALSLDMAEEPASDSASEAASSGAAPAAADSTAAEVATELQPSPTAMPAPTLAPEVFKAAPPLEEEMQEESVADAISAEPASDTANTATDASDTPDTTDNSVTTDELSSSNRSPSIQPILLWTIALLALFLLFLFLTLRTRARL